MMTLTLYATPVQAGYVDRPVVSIPTYPETSVHEPHESTCSVDPLSGREGQGPNQGSR
jgi:hypothetical protein